MAHCKNGRKSVPVNKRLYNTLKRKIKARSKVWPSAYASGQLVRAYKSKGGKYRCSFGSLDRWFKEKWVNVCQPLGNGKYKPCGRKKSSWKKYPYCRPLRRVNKSTPVTVREMSKTKIKKMCNRKRKNPRKKVFQRNKNNFGEYNMNKPEQQTCGYGNRRRPRFGIHREHPGIPSENRIHLEDKFQEANTAKIMYYENIYMNQPIHIKGTPQSKRYTVLDFRMYTPVGDSLFSYYDDDGEFSMVKASQVTGFDSLPPPPEIDMFGFGNRRRSRFGRNNLGPTDSNLPTFYRNGTATIMYYEGIYMNKPIHIKGTPESKRYTVVDFRMYTPVGDSLFTYYDDNGEFRTVKASEVTGFDEIPPPPGIYMFGFGNRRRSRFGNNIEATNSNLDTFYRNGTANSINPKTECLAGYYGKYVSRFGKKRVDFIQKANKASQRKGTVGSFNRWCRRHGYSKVTTACINRAKKNKSLKIRRKAIFAQNIRSPKRHYSFGNIEKYRRLELNELQDELEYSLERYQELLRKAENNDVLIADAQRYKENHVDLIEQILKERTVGKLSNREVGLSTRDISGEGRRKQARIDERQERINAAYTNRLTMQMNRNPALKTSCNIMFGKRKNTRSKKRGYKGNNFESDIIYLKSL